MPIFSVEIDNSNPLALAYCLKKCEHNIPDFDEWSIYINAGGIDYGVFMNFDVEKKELEISNGSTYMGCGDDCLDDVFEACEEDDEE